ncbi:hypothetical protein TNCV_5024391 [Trichonephila clavipes]|nr:hypothetical protein TNCV_5024391 [Trichonephila clavipes]
MGVDANAEHHMLLWALTRELNLTRQALRVNEELNVEERLSLGTKYRQDYISDSTFWFCSIPILWGGGSEGHPFLSSLTTKLSSRLSAYQIFRVLSCPSHLQTAMSSPGFEPEPSVQQSASLTTVPTERLYKD